MADPMITKIPSALPPPSTRPLEYEVFLSFRGLDTRKGFTDHLYKALIQHGIHTFRDEEQLKSGKPISTELSKAIEESQISVIILSTNYATSTWCLNELAGMVELAANNESRLILPVFYSVTQSEVREQTGDHFKEAFAKHDKDFEDTPGTVTRWKNSLTAVAELEGFDLTDFRYETELIDKIVERIFGVLINTFSKDLKDFVGMDRVNEIKNNMSSCIGSEEVRVIGICGMAGIGKSTVAKALSQRIRNQFDAFSFISKVGEISKKESLFYIQEQLCDHLLNKKVTTKDVNDVIFKRLRGKRVLIILDNVDEFEQIEAIAGSDGADLSDRFGKGSRIIVTTTDERLLIDYKPKIYTIEKLTTDQALFLFCRKAFKTDHPTDAFKKLSYEFVDYIDGHPLALEVFGRSLRDRKEDYWSTKLKSLKDNNYSGEKKIISVLKASYEGLENQEQQGMFLDTACFFKGEDVCRLEKIFESCGYYPGINITILCEKHLVNMVGGKLWMHDLLQKMGRDIVREESKVEGERSRLWHHTDALPVLKKNKGTGTVQGIFLRLPQPEKVHLKKDPFSNMDNLRLLKIYNVEFSGCFEFLSDELSLLEWHKCPLKSLPSSFEPGKLVELNLSQSEIEELWEDIERPLEKLVVLNLSDCQKLIKIPDFDKVPNLEQLIFKGCTCLSEVPDGINLRSLTNFNVSGCSKLGKLPEIGEDMKLLRKLYLDGTAIEELPASIKHLTGLTLLNLSDCKNLLSLPDVICTSLVALQILNVSGCSNLNELPENLGSLKCLQELYASRTALHGLPTSVKHLTGLTLLYLGDCSSLLTLPDVICTSLTSLQILYLSGCSNLNELPENLGSLECLQELYASGTAISQVPESISQLSQLGELDLDDCCKLETLPRLPFSIRFVRVRNCPLLQRAQSNKITVWPSAAAGFSFLNRQRNEDQAFWLPAKHLLWPFYQTFFEGAIQRSEMFRYSYRSYETPAWLSRRSTESTVTIPLPHDLDGKSNWIKLALCFVREAAQKHDSLEDVPEFDEELGIKFTHNHRIELCTTENPHERLLALDYPDCNLAGPFIYWYFIPRSDLAESLNKRLIQATITPDSPGTKVTGCGASLIYLEDVPKFVRKWIEHYRYWYHSYHCYQLKQEEDGVRSSPSTSGVQTEQEVQEQETTPSTRIAGHLLRKVASLVVKLFEGETNASTRTVGQLRRNVVSLLEKLFEGLQRGLPNLYDYGFIFCLRERLLWFSEQSSTPACTVNLCLPPNLHNDEKWAGLSLYVVYALPPGLPLFRTLYECNLYTPIEAVGHEQLMHRLGLCSPFDDNVGPHRLLMIYIPRVRFPERLNRCHFIQALFGCESPGVEVEMCGMRLVYDQDLKGLIQTITRCTNDRPAYYGTGDFTETKKYKGISLGSTSLLTNLLQAAKSSEHSSVTEVCPPFMPIDFRRETYSAEDSQHERKTTPIPPLQEFGRSFDPTNNMSSDQNQLLGAIQRDKIFEYGYRSNEIPAWLSRRSTESTITILLPHDLDGKGKWIKLALCFLCEAAQKHDSLEDVPEFDEEMGTKFTHNHRIELCTTENPHECLFAFDYRDCNFAGPFIHWCFIPQSYLADSSNKRLIQATITPDSPGTKVTGCGASLIYLEDVPKFVRKWNEHFRYWNQDQEEEDGMRSRPSTSGVQTKHKVQEQETTSSTRIAGQLRRNVVSLLEKLFEGLQRGLPNLYDYGFIFCLRERLLWFSEQSSTSACTVNLCLPPNLHNDEKWAGLSLYVVYALPPGLPLFRTFYECNLFTPIEAVGHEQLMHRLLLCSFRDDNVGSHRLLIIYIPRVRFPERLNRCHFIQALFGCRAPGVGVEMCGMHLVYNQDLKGLIQTITRCTNDRPAYYGTGDFTETKKYKGISLGATSLLTNLVQAAKSSEHSSVTEVCPPFMPTDFRRETYSAEDSQHERKTTPIPPLQEFGRSFDPTNNMCSDQNQLLDFERDLKHNSCYPPNEILDWFGHQSGGPSVKIPLPPNLCEDTNWIGLALCAYFSVPDHSTTDLDNLNLEISHNLTCLLETDKGCPELHGYCINSQEFEWLYCMGGFIWLSYIPRRWFADQLKEQRHLEASIGSDCGSLGVHRCGLRLIFLEDEEGLKETIMHCMTSLSDINQGNDKQHQNCEAGSSSITGSNVVNPHLESSEKPNDKKCNFGCHSMYNSCFPSSITLEWFGDQSSGSSIRVPLPPATNWIGLALCASFAIVENPTADLDNLNPEISHHLICHLESDRGTIEPLHDYCTTNEEFQWLPFGGFIWVSYIPRAWFSDQLNECEVLEASFASDHKAFTVHDCGLRLVYQHDEEEIKKTILHYMTSFSDKKGKNKQCPMGDAGSYSRPSSYIVKPHLGRPSDEKWDFDRHSIYNSCFPSSMTLEWFGHESNDSSATISLPQNLNIDSNWIGLAICAYFSVLGHPTVDIDNLEIPAISHHLICHLESDRDSLEFLHDYCTTNEEFLWLHLGGFVWVSYIPRVWFSDQLNECEILEASIASDHEAFSVQKCGLRLVYQHDEEEFKQTISRSQITKGKISSTLTTVEQDQ